MAHRLLPLRSSVVALVLAVSACASTDPVIDTEPGGGAGGATTTGSATSGSGGQHQGTASTASAGSGGFGATGPASSSATTSSSVSSTASSASSAASSSTGAGAAGPCITSCGGTECGTQMPDLCGGTIDCGDCGDNTDYCIKFDPPVYRDAVHDAILTVQAQHPEYFDFGDSAGGDSYRVLDLLGFRGALVATMLAGGYDAIGDPNSDEEIRVRGAADEAENYDVYTSGGYSAYTYTSTCTPANF